MNYCNTNYYYSTVVSVLDFSVRNTSCIENNISWLGKGSIYWATEKSMSRKHKFQLKSFKYLCIGIYKAAFAIELNLGILELYSIILFIFYRKVIPSCLMFGIYCNRIQLSLGDWIFPHYSFNYYKSNKGEAKFEKKIYTYNFITILPIIVFPYCEVCKLLQVPDQ